MLGSAAYDITVVTMVVTGTIACLAARRWPGPWTSVVAKVLSLLLVAVSVSFVVMLALQANWSARYDLPLPLCDMATVVAAAACWWQIPILVEITYFWGLAGTLQALITPDLNVSFPHLVFFQYVVAHSSIVVAAFYLTVGLRMAPRKGSAPKVLGITALYTAFVGLVDALTGADYMFLSQKPSSWTLLNVLGPWPWYVLSAAGVAVVLLTVLDAPFWASRHRGANQEKAAHLVRPFESSEDLMEP